MYGVDAPEKKNGDDEIAWSKGCLYRARAAGKPVFVVEYLNARDKIAKVATAVEEFGYVLYIAPNDRTQASQLRRARSLKISWSAGRSCARSTGGWSVCPR